MATVVPIEVTCGSDRIVIRSAEMSHAGSLGTHLVEIAEATYRVVSTPSEMMERVATLPQRIRDWRNDPDRIWLIAEAGKLVVGELSLRCHGQDRLSHVAQLGMSVAEAWQGRGIGTAMLRAGIDWAQAHPRIRRVTLSVLVENSPAIAVYLKAGFREEGRRPGQVRIGPSTFVDDVVFGRSVGDAGASGPKT